MSSLLTLFQQILLVSASLFVSLVYRWYTMDQTHQTLTSSLFPISFINNKKSSQLSQINKISSLPTRSHPFILKAEEELNKLRSSLVSLSLSYEIMLDAIKAVGQVYECFNDLLGISSIRYVLSHSKQRRFVDQELEESIKVIDISSTSRDNFDSIKGQLQDLKSATRRGESEAMKSKVREYLLLVKKANKDAKKLPAVRKSETIGVDSSDVASILLESERLLSLCSNQLFHSCQNK